MALNYCQDCGGKLEHRWIEGRDREACPACGRVQYRQLKIGAGCLVEQDGCLLLLRRTIDPGKGRWNIPAGYCEADEAPWQAAVREVLEETGLVVEIMGLVDVLYFDDDPRGNGLLALYRGKPVGGELLPNEEGTEPTWFARDRLPTDLAGAGHDQAIRAWNFLDLK